MTLCASCVPQGHIESVSADILHTAPDPFKDHAAILDRLSLRFSGICKTFGEIGLYIKNSDIHHNPLGTHPNQS